MTLDRVEIREMSNEYLLSLLQLLSIDNIFEYDNPKEVIDNIIDEVYSRKILRPDITLSMQEWAYFQYDIIKKQPLIYVDLDGTRKRIDN